MQIEEKSFVTSVFYWIGVLEKLANVRFIEDLGGGKSLVGRWRTLSILAEKDGSTINDLADHTFIERSALSRLLELMEDEGLVQRRSRPGDRRTTAVYLTRKGQQAFATMLPVRRAVFSRASAGLTPAELAEFMRIIQLLIANLSDVATGDPAARGRGPRRASVAGETSVPGSKLQGRRRSTQT